MSPTFLFVCFFALVIFQIGSYMFLSESISYLDPPTYHLPSSWDHRHMPPIPAYLLRWSVTDFSQAVLKS
jgi:hypothetical protein